MWAVDFYRERLGVGGWSGLPGIIAGSVALALLVGLARALSDMRRRPAMFVPFAGAGCFWWAAWAGHPWAGMATLAGSIIGLAWWENRQSNRPR